jgi:hypothetical protein
MIDYKFKRFEDECGKYHIGVHADGDLIATIPCYHNREVNPDEFKTCYSLVSLYLFRNMKDDLHQF